MIMPETAEKTLTDNRQPPMPANAETQLGDDRQQPIPQPTSENQQPSRPQRCKDTLRAQLTEMALDGYSCRQIGRRLGLSKSTVNRWLLELRQERTNVLADRYGMTVNAIARYESIYREAMEAWRKSKVDREVRVVENTEVAGDGGGSKKKESVRTDQQAGDRAFLAQARDAVDKICTLWEL